MISMTPLQYVQAQRAAGKATHFGQDPDSPSSAEKPAVPLSTLSPADQALQKKFPGHYARLAPPMPFSQVGTTTSSSLQALDEWRRGEPVKDAHLASLSQIGTMAGSGTIALLATLGMSNRRKRRSPIEFVPEFLGVASWFTAMALTPKIIDGMVALKTGVNLQQVYDSSYGERKKLFTDPHYIPMYLLSDKTINRVAKQMDLSPDDPDRQKKVEDRIRQISVQANTWWMLTAGPAAAVLSGFLCDLLQPSTMKMANLLRKKLATTPQNRLACRVGDRAESDISSWWKGFGRKLITKTGLKGSGKTLNAQQSSIVSQLADLSTDHPRLKRIQEFLQAENKQLDKISQEAHKILKSPSSAAIKPSEHAKLTELANSKIENARSTVNHYLDIFKAIERHDKTTPALKNSILQRMETNLSVLDMLMRDGHWGKARDMAGGEKNLSRIAAAMRQGQFTQASNWMGASPMEHLSQSLQDAMLRNRWQRRMSFITGGGLLFSTAIFTSIAVGRSFKKENDESATTSGDNAS